MLLERTNCGIEELNHDLEKINSNRMYVKLTTDADEIVINTESVLDASKSVQVVYDRNTKRFFARNAEGKEISRFSDSCDLVEVEGEITIEYFLDHSMIEVYLKSNDTSKLRGRRRTKNQCKLKQYQCKSQFYTALEYEKCL